MSAFGVVYTRWISRVVCVCDDGWRQIESEKDWHEVRQACLSRPLRVLFVWCFGLNSFVIVLFICFILFLKKRGGFY